MIAFCGRSIRLLPTMEHFMQQRSQDFPKWPISDQEPAIQRDFALQPESVMAGSEVAIAVTIEAIKTQREFWDVEFKLDVEILRERVEHGAQIPPGPTFGLLMYGQIRVNGR